MGMPHHSSHMSLHILEVEDVEGNLLVLSRKVPPLGKSCLCCKAWVVVAAEEDSCGTQPAFQHGTWDNTSQTCPSACNNHLHWRKISHPVGRDIPARTLVADSTKTHRSQCKDRSSPGMTHSYPHMSLCIWEVVACTRIALGQTLVVCKLGLVVALGKSDLCCRTLLVEAHMCGTRPCLLCTEPQVHASLAQAYQR